VAGHEGVSWSRSVKPELLRMGPTICRRHPSREKVGRLLKEGKKGEENQERRGSDCRRREATRRDRQIFQCMSTSEIATVVTTKIKRGKPRKVRDGGRKKGGKEERGPGKNGGKKKKLKKPKWRKK